MSREGEKQILLSRIKLLENLLHEHKIPFPSSSSLDLESSNKSFDEIMADVCSAYNKFNQNTKMYFIENTDTEYEIIEEEEEEDDEQIQPTPISPLTTSN